VLGSFLKKLGADRPVKVLADLTSGAAALKASAPARS
jgi:hypothetical protein